MHEPLSPIIKKKEHTSLLVISKGLLSTNTGRFIVYCSLINLTTLIAGHFFAPYMLRELKFNYITYTIINSASTLTTLGFMTWWGRRTDRAGSIKILKLTSFMIPFVPIMWLVSGNVYWIILAQILAGFAWSGFQLSSNIFIYDASPQENRTRFIALNNALLFLGISIGSLAGGFIAPHLPLIKGSYFLSVFLLSGLSRLLVVFLFLPRVSEVRDVPPVSIRELLLPGFHFSWLKNFSNSIVKHISWWWRGKRR